MCVCGCVSLLVFWCVLLACLLFLFCPHPGDWSLAQDKLVSSERNSLEPTGHQKIGNPGFHPSFLLVAFPVHSSVFCLAACASWFGCPSSAIPKPVQTAKESLDHLPERSQRYCPCTRLIKPIGDCPKLISWCPLLIFLCP